MFFYFYKLVMILLHCCLFKTISNYLLLILIITLLNDNTFPVIGQLSGGEKTMEQFLDGLLHSSVYDRRIRPFSNYESTISKLYF